MHMASSSLPDSVRRKVKNVPGVASVTPIMYLTNNVIAGEDRNLAYIIGLPGRTRRPWKSRQSLPGKAKRSLTVTLQRNLELIGDTVEILGEELRW
jgi:hypothetical protein